MANKKVTPKNTAAKVEAKKESPKKEAAKTDATMVAPKKTEVKNPAAKKETATKKDEVKKEPRLPYSQIVTRANRENWKKNNLFNMIKEAYPNDTVTMEELNRKQVCFMVGKDRLPVEGYFSVSSSFI